MKQRRGNGTGLITVNNNLINLAFAYNANSNGQVMQKRDLVFHR